MSTNVDQHVVEMRFDNKQFEQNVSTTMSTIEKLKQKLNFSGAAKGLEDVNAASKKVNMAGLGTAVETVNAKFSALQVMGVTALANITNSAVNAGKKIVSALTIDPIKTGFQEYETQINAVQTILANTESKGTDIDDVNRALEELNKYADKTIYNFTEMTRNIGTFTAAGVDLDTSVSAIQGIANLAAVSGSTSQQASTAMYQLSQALATGTVKLMDWNSVVNAGMGGEVFQNALIRTAAMLDGSAESVEAWRAANIDSFGSFRDSLTQGEWLTSEVLTKTLEQFTMTAKEGSKEWEAFKKSLMEQGYTEAQANEILEMGNRATDAATKVKTFTQLWDVMKESAQSGWSQTWKLVIGDFDDARNLLSPLAETLTGFINKMSDARNNLIQGALDFATPWSGIMKKLDSAGFGNIKKVAETIENATDKLEYFQDVVNKVWRGDFNNADTGRYDLLEKAGYDHRVVQDLVNKGLDYKITIEDIEASHAKFGLTMEKTAEETKDITTALNNLSEEQLRNAGLTDDEIKLYMDLAKEAERTGESISKLADDMSKTDGRTLLIDSFKNAGSGLLGIFKALKNAWVEIFPPMSVVQLYNIIKAINTFSEKLRLTDEKTGELTDTAKKLERTFKGVFAILDIVATIVGGGLKIAFKAASAIFDYFHLDVLDVTAAIGDALVKFRDWIDSALDFTKAIDKIAPFIITVVESFKVWKETLADTEDLPKAIAEGIVKWFTSLPKVFGNILDKISSFLTGGFEKIPGDMISGFANGIWNGIKIAGQVMIELGKIIIDKIKEVLGIHSPSTVFFAIGGFIIAGLVAGLLAGGSDVRSTIEGLASNVAEWFKKIDFGALFAGGISVGAIIGVNKIGNALESLASPFEGFGELLEGAGEVMQKAAKPIAKILKNTAKVVKSFAKVMNGIAFNIATKGIKNLAISVAILAASVIALTFIDVDKLWDSVKIIGVLAGILAGLAVVAGLMSKSSVEIGKGGAKVDGLKSSLLGIASSLLILAVTLKIIGSMKPEQYEQACEGVVRLIIGIGAIILAYGLFVKGKSAQNLDKAGSMLLKLAGAMAILAIVGKIIAGMTWYDIGKAAAGLLGLVGVVALLMVIGKIESKGLKSVSTNLIKIAGAIGILTLVAKLIAGMTWYDMGKAAVGLLGVVGIIALLTLIGKIKTNSLEAVGSNLLKISGAIAILAVTGKIIASMEWKDMAKAGAGLVALGGIIVGLVWAVNKATDRDLAKVGSTLLMLSVSIGILAMVATLLGFLSIEHLAKGVTAVGVLGAIMAGLILATKSAQNCKGNLIVMTIAIGVMAAAVAALSMIDTGKLAMATGAMVVLMAMFALMVKAAGVAKGSIGVLIVMTVAVGLLGVLLYVLAGLPIESSIGATIALSVLLLAVTGVMLLLGKIGVNVGKALSGVIGLTAMAVPLAAFVGVLALMQNVQNAIDNVIALSILLASTTAVLVVLNAVSVGIGKALAGILGLTAMAVPLIAFVGVLAVMQHVENATENVKALSILLGVVTAVLVVLELIGISAAKALVGIAALTAMAVPLIAFVGVLAVMQHVDNATENVKALTTLVTVVTLLLIPLMLVGALWPAALIGIGALTAMAVPLLAFVGVLAVMENLNNATENVTILTTLMDGLCKMMAVLAIAGPLALVGVAALTGLTALIVGIGALVIAIGAAMEKWPQLETFVDNGIPLLEKLCHGIGSFVGNLVAGFVGAIAEELPKIGTKLSEFMTNATPFITGAKLVDASVLEGVGYLAGSVLLLTAADLVAGVAAFLSGGSSFATLGTELSMFMTNAAPFIAAAKSIDPTIIDSVKSIAQVVLILTAADILEGLTSWFTGGSSLASFGAQLPQLGTDINSFRQNLGVFTDAEVKSSECAAKVILALAQAANEIPNDGGLWGKIFGENSIAAFGSQLQTTAKGLAGFIRDIGTFTEEQVQTAKYAGEVIVELAKAAKQIPNDGGLWGMIFGENSISTFGAKLPTLAKGIAGFIRDLGTCTQEQVTTAGCAADVVVALANAAKKIPNDGGLWGKIFGDNSISTFGEKLPSLGTNLKSFITNLGTFNENSVATVNYSIRAINAFSDLADADLSGAKKHLEGFGDKLVGLAKDIATFCEKMPSSSATSTAIFNVKDVLALAKDMSSIDATDVSGFTTSLKKLASDGISAFVDEFESLTVKTKAKSAGKTLMDKVIEGIEAKEDSIETAGSDAAGEGVTGVKSKYDSFKSAGSYLVDGFAAGISSNTFSAKAKAKAMAEAALQAAKDVLKINSPSKVFREIGTSVPEGFAMGIEKLGYMVTASSAGMADVAIDGVKDSLSHITDIVNSDIDAQPTIRPVLDLSGVESRASILSNLFDTNASVGVLANVKAISSMMNSNQNGSNDDIVSAIEKLYDLLDGPRGDSYNINGISYDDGSNIKALIEAIIAQARVDRRV